LRGALKLGALFSSLDEVVTREFKNSYMKNKTNPPTKDYYNRPSKQTSFQIAAISFLCAIVMVLGMMVLKLIEKVSEDKNDFDNTFNKVNKDLPIETLIDREKQFNEQPNELKSILTSKRVLRAPNEQVTSTHFTSNV
jgi:hypothetical protein